ncbi:MAG: FecR family protein [Candidatus Ozemobacteraceae bacterium]
MSLYKLHVQSIFLAAMISLSGIGFADVRLNGVGMSPPAPAELSVNATFSCSSVGSGTLSYPDGTYLNLLPHCEGQVLADGIRIKSGDAWVAYRKKGHRFVVVTPCATLGIRGTDFGVSVKKDGVSVVLMKGVVEITPAKTGEKSVTMAPGQTYSMKSGISETHSSTPADLSPWKAYSGSIAKSSSVLPSFADQFLYSLTVLESGSATAAIPGASTSSAIHIGAIIKTGSSVQTPKNSSACVSLLCGSKIRLTPGTRIKMGPRSFSLESGVCLIQNVGKSYGIKIDGQTPVFIQNNSVVIIERTQHGLLFRVEVGEVKCGGKKVGAGECAEVNSQGMTMTTQGPSPLAWREETTVPSSQISTIAAPDVFTTETQPSGTVSSDTSVSVETASDDAEVSGAETTNEKGKLQNLHQTLGF